MISWDSGVLGNWLKMKQTNNKETTTPVGKAGGRDVETPPGRRPGAGCGWELERVVVMARAITWTVDRVLTHCRAPSGEHSKHRLT